MTTTPGAHVVPREPAPLPELRAADRGVASSLEAVLADHTQRVYGAQWRIFEGWCDEVGLASLPAEPLTVARYLAARAGSGASIATIRLAHVSHRQGPRVGEAGIALPGPGRARLFEGMGPSPREAPAPGRRPHRRRAGRNTAHRRPAPQARTRY